jgi:hypothetical protein
VSGHFPVKKLFDEMHGVVASQFGILHQLQQYEVSIALKIFIRTLVQFLDAAYHRSHQMWTQAALQEKQENSIFTAYKNSQKLDKTCNTALVTH